MKLEIEITQSSDDGTILTIVANENVVWPFSREIRNQVKGLKFDSVILDCSNITYVDSSIVGTMIGFYKEGKKVKFRTSKNGNIKTILYVYGLQDILTIEEV